MCQVYSKDDIAYILESIHDKLKIVKKQNTKTQYYNVPCAFDIETSSFYQNERKVAIMYIWTFGIYDKIVIGRTWDEFVELLEKVSEILHTDKTLRLVCYIHNLPYEFQWIRKWLTWEKVFATAEREPIYALTTNGIEFRCSYRLSGYNLEFVGKNLQKHNVEKLVGNLDYTKIRHSRTEMTQAEIDYCINDVLVLLAYIAEKIETDGDITRIALTKTGYVRVYCRNHCFYENGIRKRNSIQELRYSETMKRLRLTVKEYNQLKNGFQGGFTHNNPFCAGKIYYDVTSFDFTSSYPCVMIAEEFPMSSSEVVEIKTFEEFEHNLKYYCCLFDVEIYDLESKLWFENPLSESRCRDLQEPVTSNGRLICAKHLLTTLTEQDYMIMKKFYKWDMKRFKVYNFRRYKKGYLPMEFVKSILKLYHDKTTLKGVQGKETEYLSVKEMLNSCYGMSVTDIIRAIIEYIDHWDNKPCDVEKEIEKYNNSHSRFLFYPWGVWITAYARRNLFTGILEFGDDYVYSDTDSIKVLNAEKHMDYINKYNAIILSQLERAMKFHKLPVDLIKPKTIKGVEKPLGVWDFDGHYERFKTLGAKRYIVQYSDDKRNPENMHHKMQITIAGLGKVKGTQYLCSGWYYDINGKEHNSPFEKFADDLYIPKEDSGRLTHTYIDEERSGTVTDYNGVTYNYRELSSVHLEQSEYKMDCDRYFNFIRGCCLVEQG